MATLPATMHKSHDERRQALAGAVQTQVAGGARVESQSDYQAVTVKGQRVNHLLHFIIGIFTLSAWWFLVWIPLAIFGGERRRTVTVDNFGNVGVQRV